MPEDEDNEIEDSEAAELCTDCKGPAHEEEGYHMSGKLLCLACFHEAVTMAALAAEVCETPITPLTIGPMIQAASGGAA
tara:strand:- start:17 stop:253 length:237 start_codon:yes stop_codon:yes gene_type:complete